MTATQTLAGLDDVVSGGFEPPDVQVAAGPGFVVQMVNLAERVWRTSDGPAQVVATRSLSDFFGSADDRLTDPRIVFDGLSGRWFASISDIDSRAIRLEVSQTADPTGGWSSYSFAAPGCADQPRLGIADATVVLAADVFRDCEGESSPELGGELWVVNKQQLLDGAATPASTTYGPDHGIASFAPVQSLSPTATEFVVSVDQTSSRVVHLFTVDGVPPAAVTVQPVASPSIAPLSDPPAGVEPRASGVFRQPVVATNDQRVLDAVWENGRLWLAANTGCTPAGDTVVRSCARVVELSTVTRTVTWDTNVAQADAYTFYPAIRPDSSGNLVIVYGESSALLQPELVVVVRGPDGTFSAPAVIEQSRGQELGQRFGDYFGAGRDPSTGTVWVAGEIGAEVPGDRGWNTVVASVVATGPGAMPPAVLGATPPRLSAQQLAARAGRELRLAFRALDEGAGVHAELTVTGPKGVVFTKTTAAKTVHAGSLYSVPWRPAKTLRGTFSLCVVSVSALGRQSAQSCARVTLR